MAAFRGHSAHKNLQSLHVWHRCLPTLIYTGGQFGQHFSIFHELSFFPHLLKILLLNYYGN